MISKQELYRWSVFEKWRLDFPGISVCLFPLIAQRVKRSLPFVFIKYLYHANGIFIPDINLIEKIGRQNVVTNMTIPFQASQSNLAIDGENRYDVDDCGCCSVTGGRSVTSVWWSVDLGKKYPLRKIVIYGRGMTTNLRANSFILDVFFIQDLQFFFLLVLSVLNC